MVDKRSVKLSNSGIEFLDRLRVNRIKADSDHKPMAYWELLEIIDKYFKLETPSYRDLLKMEAKTNVR